MGYLPSRGVVALLTVLITACSVGGHGQASKSPKPSSAAPGSPGAPSPTPASHVFVIVMENHSFSQAISQPYTARLAAQYALATNYHAVAHPSLPNYLALSSGSTWGIQDDGYHSLPAGGLGDQLTQAGVSWRAYMEGMGSDCMDSHSDYAVKHNPFAYYGGACPTNVVPFTSLQQDLAVNTPRFVWITPDLCHDGHDCSSATADDFLRDLVPQIQASPAWKEGGRLFITWDEDDSNSRNQVLTLVVAPHLTAHSSNQPHDHYSLLATVEDSLGVARLGHAAQAAPLTELTG
jgi:phosphatidylinositol-3-phosphatase